MMQSIKAINITLIVKHLDTHRNSFKISTLDLITKKVQPKLYIIATSQLDINGHVRVNKRTEEHIEWLPSYVTFAHYAK